MFLLCEFQPAMVYHVVVILGISSSIDTEWGNPVEGMGPQNR